MSNEYRLLRKTCITIRREKQANYESLGKNVLT